MAKTIKQKNPDNSGFLLSGKRDSNSRPQPWQGCALPTELFPQYEVPKTGIEPARLSTLAPETSASTIPPLGHKKKSGKRDSNSRPQPWQGCALPTELFPQFPFCECKGNAFSENHKIIHDFFLLNSLSLLNTSDSYSRHKNNFYRLQFVHQNVVVR